MTTQAKFEITATDKSAEAFNSVNKHFHKMHNALGGLKSALASIGALTIMGDMVREAAKNEKAFALLKSQVKATGGAAGYTADQLQAMAMQMEHVTTFSHTQIESAQSELMAFTNITGEQFRKTLQVAMDFATVTGRALPDALRTLGVAINNPLGGMGRLTTAGVSLTKEQQNQIKAMAAAGHTIEAQNTMLADLEKSYGGAATAARDTLGGALSGLKHSFDDLLQGNGGGLIGTTKAINELSKTLQDPKIQAGIAAMVTGIINLVGWLAKAITAFVKFDQEVGDTFARFATNTSTATPGLKSLNEEIKNLRNEMTYLKNASTSPFMSDAQQADFKRKLAVDQNIMRNYLASQKAMISQAHQATWGAVGPQVAGTAGASHAALSLLPTQLSALDVGVHIKHIRHAAKKASDKIKLEHIHIGVPLKVVALPKEPKEFQQISQYGVQAARNLQTSFAQFLFNPFQHGLRGMAQGFVQMIQQMVAQAMSAKIMDSLFGGGKSGAGSSNFAQGFSSIFSSLMGSGGARAAGGPVSTGNAYLVGENGPELFSPASSGHIIPTHALGGTAHHSTSVNIDARGAGPTEVARLLAFGRHLEDSIKGQVEYRLQRGGWMTQRG